MYDMMLKELTEIAGKYTDILNDTIKEQIGKGANDIDYESILEALEEGIHVLEAAKHELGSMILLKHVKKEREENRRGGYR